MRRWRWTPPCLKYDPTKQKPAGHREGYAPRLDRLVFHVKLSVSVCLAVLYQHQLRPTPPDLLLGWSNWDLLHLWLRNRQLDVFGFIEAAHEMGADIIRTYIPITLNAAKDRESAAKSVAYAQKLCGEYAMDKSPAAGMAFPAAGGRKAGICLVNIGNRIISLRAAWGEPCCPFYAKTALVPLAAPISHLKIISPTSCCNIPPAPR